MSELDETKTIERAKPYAVRAYPKDIATFQVICKTGFENQQSAFKALLAAFKSPAATNTPEQGENPAIDSLIVELSEKNTLIDELTAKIEGLTQQLTDANAALTNPLLAELDTNAATAMRKIRPFITKEGGLIKNPTNFKNEFVNIAVKFLINKQYSNLL